MRLQLSNVDTPVGLHHFSPKLHFSIDHFSHNVDLRRPHVTLNNKASLHNFTFTGYHTFNNGYFALNTRTVGHNNRHRQQRHRPLSTGLRRTRTVDNRRLLVSLLTRLHFGVNSIRLVNINIRRINRIGATNNNFRHQTSRNTGLPHHFVQLILRHTRGTLRVIQIALGLPHRMDLSSSTRAITHTSVLRATKHNTRTRIRQGHHFREHQPTPTRSQFRRRPQQVTRANGRHNLTKARLRRTHHHGNGHRRRHHPPRTPPQG